eukprot:jgi/Pico_ML_1/53178/g3776.t1
MGVVAMPQTRGWRAPAAQAVRKETVARVQFKATKLMTKRRPKKTLHERTRKPAEYPPKPTPPPIYTVVGEEAKASSSKDE